MWTRVRQRGGARVLLLAPVLAVALVPSCSSTEGSSSSTAAVDLTVTERDFHISLSAHEIDAGTVSVRVVNQGPAAHEVLFIRADEDEDGLPMRADGVTIDEEALARRTAGKLEPGPVGATRVLRMELEPGEYEVVCNMAGHYLGGMYEDLEVEG